MTNVAIVHDYLVKYGGAERFLEALLKIYPDAHLHTLLYEPSGLPKSFSKARIIPSALNQKRWARRNVDRARPLMPFYVEQIDLSGYDLVISSAHSFIKGVLTKPETLHICYCHTPTRYLWHQWNQARAHVGGLAARLLPWGLSAFRTLDYFSAQRPDFMIANSSVVARRIKKYYHREAAVIHPPVGLDTARLTNAPQNAPFLVVSRLEPHKRVEIAVAAATRYRFGLDVVGEGSQRRYLQAMAGSNVRFHGFVEQKQLWRFYRNARALLFPQEEDFGITAIEALSAGRPVIAYQAGSAPEILSPSVAQFFAKSTPEDLYAQIRRHETRSWNPRALRAYSTRFTEARFTLAFKTFVAARFKKHQVNLGKKIKTR